MNCFWDEQRRARQGVSVLVAALRNVEAPHGRSAHSWAGPPAGAIGYPKSSLEIAVAVCTDHALRSRESIHRRRRYRGLGCIGIVHWFQLFRHTLLLDLRGAITRSMTHLPQFRRPQIG